MKSPVQKNAMKTTVFEESIYMDLISRKNGDVEYFRPIGNVHQEWLRSRANRNATWCSREFWKSSTQLKLF